jgi:phenylpropionate dioxygenase-like ring-hydroxylating dioxygenase large terminal subunit
MKNFNELAVHLNAVMLNESLAFSPEKNPVIQAMPDINSEQLLYIITQYTILPKELVGYMELTKEKSLEIGWNEVAYELEENIAEELGRGNEGVSHYIMLASGLEQGLDVSVQDQPPSAATELLIQSLKKIFEQDNAYVFGAMYAVERVSIPELTVTLKIIESLLDNQLPDELKRFFELHLNVWEIEHEEDLRKSIAKYLKPSDFYEFEAGFRIVLNIFDIWWKSLVVESILNYPRARTKQTASLANAASASQSAVKDKKKLGLEGACYFSEAFSKQEKELLFNKTWQFVGHESALPEIGDYFTVSFLGENLFIIRTEANTLKAFHNVCTHRGAKILEGKGNCNKIRCPYHAWIFDLSGQLKGMHRSQHFSMLDKSTASLAAITLESWRGLIFINLDPACESLMDYLAGFPAHLEEYEHNWEDLREIDRWSYDEPVNWKFFIENYSEYYHLTTIHAQSLKLFDAKSIVAEATGLHHKIRMAYAEQDSVRDHQIFAGEPAKYSCQGIIFPNLMVNTAKDNVSVFKLIPLSPTSTRFEVIIYQTKQQQQLFPYDLEKFRAEFDSVLQEDFSGVRLLQASVHSKAYGVHHYAEGVEFGITDFHNNLRRYLSTDLT